MFTHPNQIFRKTIFWPLGSAAPQIFSQALENNQVLLAHPSSGTRAPFTICFQIW